MNLQAVCHTEESFSMLPDRHREIVEELARLIPNGGLHSPFYAKEALWSAFAKFGIVFPPGVFELLEPEHSIEVWTSDTRFLFAMGDILQYCSYSLHDLATSRWEELFSRDTITEKRMLGRLVEAMKTGNAQKNVTDWHLVTESKSEKKNSLQVKVSLLVPFQSRDVSGVFALVKVKPTSSAVEKKIISVRALFDRFRQSFGNWS